MTNDDNREDESMSLYDTLLPHIQDANTYGGGASTFLLRKPVFEAIDQGADAGDKSLKALRDELHQRSKQWNQVQDHEALSRLMDTYCEATFYLAATHRGISIEGIPMADKSTPDFRTTATPAIHFEIKTIDIANPALNYDKQMQDGLDANIEAHERAKQKGVGFSEREIAPHGDAETWLDVVRQVMEKLAGNIKKNQYTAAPTFLVANLGRTSIRVDPRELASTYPVPACETLENQDAAVSGQLWTIAKHSAGCPFVWQDADARIRSGDLQRAGLLDDFDFIKGIVFTTEPWSDFDDKPDWRDSYKFIGIWNQSCSLPIESATEMEARKIFDSLCTSSV